MTKSRDIAQGDSDWIRPVAANGLLDRRLFLQGGIGFGAVASAPQVFGAASAVATQGPLRRPPWMQKSGVKFTPYGTPSPHESDVARYPAPNRVMRNNGAAWTPLHLLQGTITPNGLHFERHHNGVPDIDPAQHQLLIHGLVQQPLFFTGDRLQRYPMVSRICFLECGGNSNAGWNSIPSRAEAGYFHGLVSGAEWTGIPLAILLDEAGIKRRARWIIAEGADPFAMNISIPLHRVLEDGLLALYQNGERLRPENGYPMRLILPGLEGVLNVKWLRRLRLAEQPAWARNETVRYSELLPDGTSRMFSFVMEAKSLITSPSSGMVLKDGPGLYQITGLAWSGNGKVATVEVSSDGGNSWAEAELQEPVLAKALTRFRIPWRWNGTPALLKSRAKDETGYLQPEREELLRQRGRHGFYHYNAIVTWAVDSDGSITHVYGREDDFDISDPAIDSGWD